MTQPRLDSTRAPDFADRFRHPKGRLIALSVLAPLALFSDARFASAQDVIHYQPSDRPGTRATVFGEIVEFGGAALRVRLSGGRTTRIDAERVLSIECDRSSQQTSGDDSFARQNYRLALSDYRAALENERRAWIRREILAQAVRCYRELGDLRGAADTFFLLYEREPTLEEFASIPLAWVPSEPPRSLASAAGEWIDRNDSPAAMLIGASLLLSTRQRDVATRRLRTLMADDDSRIAWMAQVQLWRTETASVAETDIRNWQQAAQRMPDALRAGPYVVIGRAWSARGRNDEAALAWLRVPILHGQDRTLSAYALGVAGRALEDGGDFSGAQRLYMEIIEHYADKPAAEESRQRLEQGRTISEAGDRP